MTIPHIVLVENFAPDRQESMARFSRMIREGLEARGIPYQTIAPLPRFAKLVKDYRFSGLPKWLGYIDKLLVFPRELASLDRAMAKRGPTVFHIIDHSNAPYARSIHHCRSLVTCHDLLAVRGALGDESVDCSASWFGKKMQKSILRGLACADHVACDSNFTRQDLLRLLGDEMAPRSEVALLGINHDYRVLSADESAHRLQAIAPELLRAPFVLHVGSNLKRKNKRAVVEALASIREGWAGLAVFCGPALPNDLLQLAESRGVRDRIVNLIKPDNDALEALYNRAHALLFPSTSEGFGWPVVEAQACGCPVICSDRTAVPEVAGDGAIICPADDPAAMGRAILTLEEPGVRQDLATKGLANAKRFEAGRMVDDYLKIYQRLCQS